MAGQGRNAWGGGCWRRRLAAGLARSEGSPALGAATGREGRGGIAGEKDSGASAPLLAALEGGTKEEEGFDPDWGYISRLGGPRVRRGLGCGNGWPWVAGMGGWEAQEAR